MRHLMPLALAAFAFSANAQTMYRCGTEFSQQPCAPDARAIPTPGVRQPVVPDPAKTQAMKAVCADAARAVPVWKNAYSVQVRGVYRGEAETRKVDGTPRLVRSYWAEVVANNSFGEPRKVIVLCAANMAETSLLDVRVASQ